MSFRFQPDRCMAIIAAWPDKQTTPQLPTWLWSIGVAEVLVHNYGEGQMDCCYNWSVKLALDSPRKYNQFIFADKDIWPSVLSQPFLEERADVVACKYPTPQKHSWDAPDAFHTGLWRTKRKVLERVGIRPFQWQLNAEGIASATCLCEPFAERVKACGFTVACAGEAHHVPRGRIDDIKQITLTRPLQKGEVCGREVKAKVKHV